MIEELSFRGREISITTGCMYNHRTHWHGGRLVEVGPGHTSYRGNGLCMTTTLALWWLLTGHRGWRREEP